MCELIYLYIFITKIYKETPKSKINLVYSLFIYFITYYILSFTTFNYAFIIYITSIIYYLTMTNNKNINYYLIALISLPGLLIQNSLIIKITYLVLAYLLKNKLNKLINCLNSNKKLLFILIGVLYISILIFLLYRPITLDIISNLINMLIINTLIISNTEKNIKLNNLKKKYQDLKIYSNNNDELVTNYRSLNHENKNHLIIIKGMISETKQELENYIDNLIMSETKINNKFLNDLKYIPLPGIKNFVNYKLIQLENINTTIEIYISKEIEKIIGSKIDIINLDNFYTIIGVLLDNMIDSMKEQEERLVSINVYMEQNTTNIELANTYQKYIDISKLAMPNYTTKGKNHGIGLYLVNNIIKNNKIFELNTRIDNKFFVQHLKIHHPKNHIK